MTKQIAKWIAIACTAVIIGCAGGGSESSSPQPVAPQITTAPAALTVAEGQSATLSVSASGTAPLTYQWQRNGVDIAGATTSSYALPTSLISDNGAAFTVIISNSAGRVTSNSATLAVTGASTSQVIGSAGGVVTLTSNDVKTTITFPASAVVTNTTINLQSLPPVGKELARIDLAPIGLQFGSPVTIKFELPTARIAKSSDLIGLNVSGKKVFMPTTVDVAARTMTTQVQYFGMRSGVGLNRFAPSVDDDSRKQTLIAASDTSTGDGTLTLDELAILQPAEDVVNQALVDMQATGRFEDAARLQLSIANVVQLGTAPGWNIDAEFFLKSAATSVCAGLSQSLTTAQSTSVLSYGDYRRVASSVVYWEAASQALGADACAGNTWLNVLHAKLNEALTFISGKVQVAPSPTGYGPAAGEIRTNKDLGNEATTLGLNVVAQDTRQLYVDPALMPVRVAAFTTSQSNTDQSQYVTLLNAFGPTQSLSDDAQYAATTFTVTSKDNAGATIAAKAFGRGITVGAPVKTGAISAKSDGTIEIAGNIAVLHCPNPAAERLQILFEGVEVANIGSSGELLLGINPVLPTLSASALLRAAGITPSSATQHRLEIKRINSSCITSFAIYDDVLAAVTLDFRGNSGKIAFVRSRDIYTMNPDGSGITQLTRDGGSTAPTWSPDHRKIAFNCTFVGGVNTGHNNICVMNADGSGVAQLTSHPDTSPTPPSIPYSSGDFDPAWSPDGTRIAFARYIVDNNFGGGRTRIYTMAANGSGAAEIPTSLMDVRYPTWSPDGGRISFTSSSGGISIINTNGSGLVTLRTNEGTRPSWVSNGNKIAYLNGSQILVMNADGSGETPLGINASDFALSPDGTQLVFSVSGGGSTVNLHVVNIDGSNSITLATGSDPTW